jgi:hypothetical protein
MFTPVWFSTVSPEDLITTWGTLLVQAMAAMCSPSTRAAQNSSSYFTSAQQAFVRSGERGSHRRPLRFDAVITHVDPAVDGWMVRAHKDAKAHGRLLEGARFRDNGEVVFAVRSLLMYARAFLRDIVLVVETAAHAQHSVLRHVQAEVDAAGIRLRIVTHHDLGIGPKTGNATYNSNAIEASLHRAPGLSDWFLYLNNDMVLGRPLGLWDLFRPAVAISEDRRLAAPPADSSVVLPSNSEVRSIPADCIERMLNESIDAMTGRSGGGSGDAFEVCLSIWRDWLSVGDAARVVASIHSHEVPAAILLEPLAFAEKVPVQMRQRRNDDADPGLSAFPLRAPRRAPPQSNESNFVPSETAALGRPRSLSRSRRKEAGSVSCERRRSIDPFALRMPNQPPISVNATAFPAAAAGLFKSAAGHDGDRGGGAAQLSAVAMACVALEIPSACDFASRKGHRLALAFRLTLWRRLRMVASTRAVPRNATAFFIAAMSEAREAVARSDAAGGTQAAPPHHGVSGLRGPRFVDGGAAALPLTDGDRFPDFVKHNERVVRDAFNVHVTHTFAHAPRLFNRHALGSLLDGESAPALAAAARFTRARPFRHYRDVWTPFVHDAATVSYAVQVSELLHHPHPASALWCSGGEGGAAVSRAVRASRLAPGRRPESAASVPAAVNYLAEKMWPCCDRGGQESAGNGTAMTVGHETTATDHATTSSPTPSDAWVFALDRKPLYFFAMAGDRRQLELYRAELRGQETLFATVNDNFRGSGELPASAVEGVGVLLRAAVGVPEPAR